MLGRKIEMFIFSILQKRPRIFKEVFLLGRIIKMFTFFNSSKKNFVFMLGRKIKQI